MCLQQPLCKEPGGAGFSLQRGLQPPHVGKRNRRRRGSAVVEAALMLPWLYMLFVGVFDVGFYCVALMTTANAARVAALQASQSYTDTTTAQNYACTIVLQEMQDLPNVFGNYTTCGAGQTVNVTANCLGIDAGSSCGGSCTGVCALQIIVDYSTVNLIPIPGLLSGQFTFEQQAEMVFGG